MQENTVPVTEVREWLSKSWKKISCLMNLTKVIMYCYLNLLCAEWERSAVKGFLSFFMWGPFKPKQLMPGF